MSQELTIVFDEFGAKAIYDDALSPTLEALGEVSIKRASEVEPTEEGWWSANMARSGGECLGPFRLRGHALAAERDWLRRNLGL